MLEPARVIRNDAEALLIAKELAETFKLGSYERDRNRRLPLDELTSSSQSGLWGITVPRAHGGAQVSYATVAKVFATISAADPSIGQIQQNHVSAVHFINLLADPDQKAFFFAKILEGHRFGNASSERGTSQSGRFSTRLSKNGENTTISGEKFYSTGALFAHFITVIALDDEDRAWVAVLEQGTPGLTIIDDWRGFGQRTTASGTVVLEKVIVPQAHLLPLYLAYEQSAQGAVSQITHVGIDAGIARGAIEETIEFVRTKSRPWRESGVNQAWEDPFVISAIGDLIVRLHAAEAMMERAGYILDAAVEQPSRDRDEAALAAVAEAKVLTTEVALLATNKLFEIAGTSSTDTSLGLDRHWRNARTHTLHDPVRWRLHAVGNYYLNNTPMPRR
jgi:SfnB family sulfur acquisition oxidoreductase